MGEKHKKQFITSIAVYALVYLIATFIAADGLIILLKPGATLLAWVSMRFYTPMLDSNQTVKNLVSIAFLSWFVADVIAMVGELIILTAGITNPQFFYDLEIVLYAVSRIMILLTIAGLYRYVTKNTSKFQVIADLLTLATCIIITIWLVFFKPAAGETMYLLINGSFLTIFSLFYICVSLFVQGLLLMNWLYFKDRRITIGHKLGLTGLAVITFTDTMCAFYPGLLYQGDTIDITFKAGILLVAVGGVFFNQQTAIQLSPKHPKPELETWKNGFYFFAYPTFAVFIVGWDIDVLIFLLVIAFYMVCCLYTRQIDVTRGLLEKEQAYNESMKNQYYFTSQLLDAMPSGIFYLSRDGVLLGMNNRLKLHYGPEAENFIYRPLSEFPWTTSEEHAELAKMKQETLANKKPAVRQTVYQAANGKKGIALYSLNVYYLADGSVGGFLGLFTDITELKQKESELEVALKEANAATEAKSQFLANMSHEIRTPMNAIIGMAYLTLQTELSPKQEDYVMKIHGASTALLGIINDILDYSKIESGKLTLESIDFNLEKVVTDTVALFAEKAFEKKLEFIVHLSPELPCWFRGDPLRLGQVLTNLVGNAVKFTKSGDITVTVSPAGSLDNRQQLKFSVKDTGIGINHKNLEKLFEPFTQSDNSTTRHYGGTGLGLTISRNLVEIMGGALWAESTRNVGSTFTFTIWLEGSQRETGLETEPIQKKNSSNCLAGIRILLAEDNPVNRQIAEELMGQEGAQVVTVANGQEALDQMINMAAPDDYDLILMDLQMPVMDGFEAARKIRIINRTIPILAMTARTMADEKEACIAAGMNDHIAKPIDPLLMYNTIVKYVSPRKMGESNDKGYKKEIAVFADSIPEIAGIDREAVARRFSSNQSLFISLLTLFSETQSQMAAEFETALAVSDREGLKRLLHTAKGVLGNIGATPLFEQVKAIEGCCGQTANDSELRPLLAQFSHDFKQLYMAIGQTMAANSGNQQRRFSGERQDDKQLAEIIARLQNLLEDGDSEALDYFLQYRMVLAAGADMMVQKQLDQAIRSYDFDAAWEILNGFKKKNR
jgi:PAS domain S-box-containing protein